MLHPQRVGTGVILSAKLREMMMHILFSKASFFWLRIARKVVSTLKLRIIAVRDGSCRHQEKSKTNLSY